MGLLLLNPVCTVLRLADWGSQERQGQQMSVVNTGTISKYRGFPNNYPKIWPYYTS